MIKESGTIELKESLANETEILTSGCAFTNSNGGSIYIGIRDNGTVIGTSVGKNSIENLARRFTENISPPLYVNIDEESIDGKTVLKIIVPKSEYKPHFFKGIAYIRVGKIDKIMSPQELTSFFRSKFLEEAHFDRETSDANLGDIDTDTVKQFVRKSGARFISTKNALKNLRVLKNDKILNAGILFFGKDPSLFFPLYGLKCAVFSRTDIKIMRDFNGNLFSIVDPAVKFIVEQIPKQISFEKAERTEIPIIPQDALREAIVNALIHRDYIFPSAVYVAIYDDRIEIKNPGILPPELSEADLYAVHSSHPRNPLIAGLAHRIKYIEHWGTGTLKILKSMRDAGLNDPIFRQERGFFHTVLSFERTSLTPRQLRILEFAKGRKELTTKEIKKEMREKISERTLKSDVRKLVERGFLIRLGKGKQTRYSIYV